LLNKNYAKCRMKEKYRGTVTMMLLNEKISIIRKMNNLTQESFAEELAVSRQAVSKWEKGDSVPDVQMITKIADNYNITLDQLVRDEYDLPGMKELSTDIENAL